MALVVTLALLCAIQGGGIRAFSRWLTRAYLPLLPHVLERTRLARLFKTPTAWTTRFLAAPTVLGVADREGITLIHPMREGRSPAQIGKQGKRNHRWIVGGQRCFILHQWGLICAWDCATAHDTHFHPLSAQFDGPMVGLTETGFHMCITAPAQRHCRRRQPAAARRGPAAGSTVWRRGDGPPPLGTGWPQRARGNRYAARRWRRQP